MGAPNDHRTRRASLYTDGLEHILSRYVSYPLAFPFAINELEIVPIARHTIDDCARRAMCNVRAHVSQLLERVLWEVFGAPNVRQSDGDAMQC